MPSIDSLTMNNVFLTAQNGVAEKLANLDKQMQGLPSVLDEETLNNLVEGEYDITLKEYTDLNTYRNTMGALYGANSANPLYSRLNTLMGNNNNTAVSAKTFIENMRERGLSDEGALNLYTAMRTYSVTNTLLGNNSFVNARV